MSQKSDTDIENENYTIIDDFTAFDSPTEEGNTEENNIKIIIKVKHDEVSNVEVSSEFKLNIAKEIIDSIKFVTTSNKIEFPNETDEDVDFEGENDSIIVNNNRLSNKVVRSAGELGYQIRLNTDNNYVLARSVF